MVYFFGASANMHTESPTTATATLMFFLASGIMDRVNGNETPDKIELVGPDKGFSKNIGTLFFCVDVGHFAILGVNDLGTPS